VEDLRHDLEPAFHGRAAEGAVYKASVLLRQGDEVVARDAASIGSTRDSRLTRQLARSGDSSLCETCAHHRRALGS
jgi:hypothetical protein